MNLNLHRQYITGNNRRDIDDSFPIVHRNLGMAYYKQYNDMAGAIESYEKAISLNPGDQRLLCEADLIHAAARTDPEKRLKLLKDHQESHYK